MWHIFDKGGPVMYPLLACSILALSVVIERAIFWLRLAIKSHPSLVHEILELARQGDWESIKNKTVDTKDYIIKILVSGILHKRRFMGVLDTMITVAPLLGIFGTVLGIISSFEVLGSAGIEHPQEVTAGIAQALITTAAGLGIAILSVFPYNYFNSRVENAAVLIEKYATSLEIVFEKLTQPGGNNAAEAEHENPSAGT
jgi:biopolymer transport protein ExbB